VTAFELRASEVVVHDGGRLVEARGDVRATDGRTSVRAGEAVYRVAERRILLSGGVAVVGPEGTLRAATATIALGADRRIGAVEAAGRAELASGGRLLRAQRIHYAVGGSEVTAAGNVTVFLPPDLTAGGERLTLRQGVAALTGGVRLRHRDGVLEGDALEVSEADQVARARGNVRSRWQEVSITAQAATVYHRERRAVFRDQVTVSSPGRTMHSALVTVYYAQRRIVAEGETTIRLEEEGGP